MYSAHKLNKQGDNTQPWHTPFPIWSQSVVPCPVLTVAAWPAYRFLKRQVRWSGIPINEKEMLVYFYVELVESSYTQVRHKFMHAYTHTHTHTRIYTYFSMIWHFHPNNSMTQTWSNKKNSNLNKNLKCQHYTDNQHQMVIRNVKERLEKIPSISRMVSACTLVKETGGYFELC